MLRIAAAMCSCGVAAHFSLAAASNSSRSVGAGLRWRILALRRAQMFSTGLRSGLFTGHNILSIRSSWKYMFTIRARWHGALSSMKTNPWPTLSALRLTMGHRISSSYSWHLTFLIRNTTSSVRLVIEIPPYSVIVPPQNAPERFRNPILSTSPHTTTTRIAVRRYLALTSYETFVPHGLASDTEIASHSSVTRENKWLRRQSTSLQPRFLQPVRDGMSRDRSRNRYNANHCCRKMRLTSCLLYVRQIFSACCCALMASSMTISRGATRSISCQKSVRSFTDNATAGPMLSFLNKLQYVKITRRSSWDSLAKNSQFFYSQFFYSSVSDEFRNKLTVKLFANSTIKQELTQTNPSIFSTFHVHQWYYRSELSRQLHWLPENPIDWATLIDLQLLANDSGVETRPQIFVCMFDTWMEGPYNSGFQAQFPPENLYFLSGLRNHRSA